MGSLVAGLSLLAIVLAWLHAGHRSPAPRRPASRTSSPLPAITSKAGTPVMWKGWIALHDDLVKRMPVHEGSPAATQLGEVLDLL